MNLNKKKALMQSIVSFSGIIASLFIETTTTLSKAVKLGLIIFFVLLLFDGLKRLFKRTEPTTMGRIDEDK